MLGYISYQAPRYTLLYLAFMSVKKHELLYRTAILDVLYLEVV